ncbi:hypothetical protein AERO9A_320006 [Aeromonas salmonicida]|nr:hypothetical protein AERO9A_320006 [Aeromonas salmonicida]
MHLFHIFHIHISRQLRRNLSAYPQGYLAMVPDQHALASLTAAWMPH